MLDFTRSWRFTFCYDLLVFENTSLILFQVEQTYKQYIKDTVKLFDATGPDALEFAAHLFHYESRIAEITPPESVLNDPHASNNLISIGELSQIARSVSTHKSIFYNPI